MVRVIKCENCCIKECKLCGVRQEKYLYKKGSARCNQCLYKLRKEYLKEYNKRYAVILKERRRIQTEEKQKQKQKIRMSKINDFMERELGPTITVSI